MFILFDQVRAVVPPIHVVIDASPSTPDWVKVLIAASAGAFFGILSSTLMEFVKPVIAKMLLRKTVSKQMASELLDNLNNIDAGVRILDGVNGKPDAQQHGAMNLCGVLAASCKTDRFDHYFAEEKSLVYEIDDNKALQGFYQIVKDAMPTAALQRDYATLKQLYAVAGSLADAYIRKHELVYVPDENQLEQAYLRSAFVPDPIPAIEENKQI